MYQAKRKDELRILDCVCKDLPEKSRSGRKRMSSSSWKCDCKSVHMIFFLYHSTEWELFRSILFKERQIVNKNAICAQRGTKEDSNLPVNLAKQ